MAGCKQAARYLVSVPYCAALLLADEQVKRAGKYSELTHVGIQLASRIDDDDDGVGMALMVDADQEERTR